MRIASLTMQNFRCFRQSTTLDLDADVVAIYGRNGSGKTSVFDAIEFALLGEIGRFASEPEMISYLPNALESALPSVRLEYDDKESRDHIEASLQQDGTIDLSPPWSNHRDLLYDWLVLDEYEPARREIGAIRDLFRATVLLSQWSIGEYVRADPASRASTLAHIAGVPYLQRCLEKAQDVQRLAGRREGQALIRLEELVAGLRQVEAELAAAEQRTKAVRNRMGRKRVSLRDLENACNAARLPIGFSEVQSPQENASAVVALCSEAIVDLDARDRLLSELEIAARGRQQRIQQREQMSKERANLQTSAAQLEKREGELRTTVSSIQTKIRAEGSRLEDLTAKVLALDEFSNLRAQLTAQREIVSGSENRERDLRDAVRDIRKRLEACSAKIAKEEAARLALTRSRSSTVSSLEKLRELRDSLPAYTADVATLRQCDLQLPLAVQELRNLRAHSLRLQQTYDASKSKLAAARQRHDELASAQQRKNSLVASLSEYATGDECPLCGATHKSPQALAEAIEKNLKATPQEIRILTKQIETDHAELQRAESEMLVTRQSIADCEKRRAALAAEHSSLVNRIASRDRMANDADSKMDTITIESAISAVEARLQEHAKSLKEIEAEIERLTHERSQIDLTVSQLESTLGLESQKVLAAKSTITGLLQRAADLGFTDPLNWSADELARERTAAAKNQDAIRATKSSDETSLTRFTEEWNSIRDARARVESDLNERGEKLERLSEAIGRTDRQCQQLGIASTDPEASSKKMRQDLADLRGKLGAASVLAERYRWSSELDSLDEQERSLRTRQQELLTARKTLEKESGRLGNAREVAGRWSERLQDEVTEVVERRIRTHQPEILRLFRAMVPQPYLFEEIDMRRSETGVHLGLKYRDQVRPMAEPSLFLSEAQANVLALAVFLSFACSQKWSRLQTIFLDDPVQHLDDLDAVAFLDSLRAVALERRKQVIVSTCDQNLYLLMIRKFRVTGKEGIHFRGISLLENGSNAPEVVYDIGGPSPKAEVA